MKVTIRTLQQKTFEVDAEPQHTVLNLKQKVGSVQGEPAEHLKLFYAGRTLSDDQRSIESLNLKENSYLVVMISKPRTGDFEPAKAKFNTSATATTSASIPPLPIFPRSDLAASAPPKNPVPSTSFSAPSHTPTPKPSVEPQSSAFDSNKWMSGSSMFGGSAPGDSVKNLVDMGFERDQVMKALKASFGNTERAVEYLTTGIPEDLGESPSTSSSTSAFRPFGMSGNAFSSGSFPSAGPGPSAFGPFDPPSSFIRPRPTEMVGHIEEVDPDQVEEPSKLVDSEPTPPSPPTVPKEIVDPSEPIKSATEPTQSVPATLPDELLSVASSTQPAAPTPPSIALPPSPTLVPSPTVPPSPTLSPSPIAPPSPTPSPPPLPVAHTLPSVSAPSPSVISPPTPSTSSSTFAPSQPDFSALSALAGFGGGFGGENITLESLRDDPTVRQIRELAGQNPDLIRPLFEHLVQSKPQVMGLLASNPEAFVRLLLPEANNPHEEPTTHAISVTDEEKEAIERLVSLGFPQTMVIQAYFAFDKNEEAAANYLIENCDDD